MRKISRFEIQWPLDVVGRDSKKIECPSRGLIGFDSFCCRMCVLGSRFIQRAQQIEREPKTVLRSISNGMQMSQYGFIVAQLLHTFRESNQTQ